jgi:L-histidine Nalpha-methyltransferase
MSAERSKGSFEDRLAELTRRLAAKDSPLALGLWERGTAVRIGQVTRAIKGVDTEIRRIEDGYQYVGGLPAHMWKAAATDGQYKTLSYGISTFWKRWAEIVNITTIPKHYVSIGPGTGEKDATILEYLREATEGPIVYIPVDISADILRMSLDVSLRGVDEKSIDVLPVELDITSDIGLDGLRQVIELMTDGPVLISLLGNTVANFRDDQVMLDRISTLLSSNGDQLLLEVATTERADDDMARLAGNEYEGSVSFRNFVMAALAQYTNLTPESGEVRHQGRVLGNVLEIATLFMASRQLKIYVNDTDHFVLPRRQAIELYRSRKYTDKSFNQLTRKFTLVGQDHMPYSEYFGLLTAMLQAKKDGGRPLSNDEPV